nr:unnamed protein product [Callosobruchus analis]
MFIEIFIRGNQKSRSGGERSEENQNMRRNIENDVPLLKAEGKTKLVQKGGWVVDGNIDVAMKPNYKIKIIGKRAGEGFVWLEMQEVVIYGCYISPNIGIERFLKFLNDITKK